MDSRAAQEPAPVRAAPISHRRLATDLSADRPGRIRPYDRDRPYVDFYRSALKRGFDIAVAIVALFVAMPLMIILGLVIVGIDGFPLFFAQERIGRDLRPFRMIKFRTMRRNAEATLRAWKEADDPRWHEYLENNFKIADDPRLLPFGRLLRRYSLDELPQLWNVLRGQMSMVGPRPLPLIQHDEMARTSESRAFVRRAGVRPGITGLWQVSGRSSTTFEELLNYDLDYVENVCLWNDAVILARTVRVVLSGSAAV
jgi:lipopolysaccharide/colanic/teichoic acid biosynthesis glycosyltransferase